MLYNYRGKKPQIFRVYCIKFSHLFSKLNTLGLWISLCKLWLWCTLYTAHTHITPTYIHDTYLWNVFGLSVCNLCLRRHILFLSSTCCSFTSLLQQAATKYIVTSCARVLAYTCLKHGAVSQDTWLHFFLLIFRTVSFFFSHLQGVSKSGEHGASRLSSAESVSMYQLSKTLWGWKKGPAQECSILTVRLNHPGIFKKMLILLLWHLKFWFRLFIVGLWALVFF